MNTTTNEIDNGATAENTATAAAINAAPSVLVIDQMHKTDAFFANLKTLCGMVSKDETRRIITRVCVEACELDTGHKVKGDDGTETPVMVSGSRFIATDGRRLATLETERVFAPGLYEIKQAKGKTIVLSEDKNAGVFPNWQLVIPVTVGRFETHSSDAEGILYAASRLGVILNSEYVFCLHQAEYTVYIGDQRDPILVKNDGRFTMVLMPLRLNCEGHNGRRVLTALDKEVVRRVVAELAEAEEQAEKDRGAGETGTDAAAVA